MTTLYGFRRQYGEFGIRNHLFALPAVVCANQVAIDIAMRYPQLKYIEHQHGCAQIGADLLQTRRIFSQLAVHPNVYGSVMVSLGCEGLMARELFNKVSNQTAQPIELVVIQEAGGTLQAEVKVDEWVLQTQREAKSQSREQMNWTDLTIGFMFDEETVKYAPLLRHLLSALRDLGVRIVLPSSHRDLAQSLSAVLSTVSHGSSSRDTVWAIEPGSNALEDATGLTAAGAHVILHVTEHPHAFGSPLAPTLRLCLDERIYAEFCDDFDGALREESDIVLLLEKLARVVNGVPSVAESLGMDDFALYRIGPTV